MQENKNEKVIKEKLHIEYENNKEHKLILFFGGKFTIYILSIIILLFIAIWLYTQISSVFTPVQTMINSLLTPILVGYIFFYVLRPVVKFFNKKLPKLISVILALLVGISVILMVFIGGIPIIIEQTQNLITAMPGIINTVQGYLNANADNVIVKEITTYMNESLNISHVSNKALSILSSFAQSAASTLSSMAVVIMTAPFVLFFLLKDATEFHHFILGKLPEKIKEPVSNTLDEIDDKVGSYISGQMLVSLCIGFLLFIGYQIIGLEYAISLATLAALLSIVPYLGPMIAITPAMLVAAATDWVMILKMLVVWGVVQFLEGNIISPNIMGRSMDVHPLTVIFVLIIAANLMGIVGAIIGIPLYAILKILVVKIFNLIKARYNRIYKAE